MGVISAAPSKKASVQSNDAASASRHDGLLARQRLWENLLAQERATAATLGFEQWSWDASVHAIHQDINSPLENPLYENLHLNPMRLCEVKQISGMRLCSVLEMSDAQREAPVPEADFKPCILVHGTFENMPIDGDSSTGVEFNDTRWVGFDDVMRLGICCAPDEGIADEGDFPSFVQAFNAFVDEVGKLQVAARARAVEEYQAEAAAATAAAAAQTLRQQSPQRRARHAASTAASTAASATGTAVAAARAPPAADVAPEPPECEPPSGKRSAAPTAAATAPPTRRRKAVLCEDECGGCGKAVIWDRVQHPSDPRHRCANATCKHLVHSMRHVCVDAGAVLTSLICHDGVHYCSEACRESA